MSDSKTPMTKEASARIQSANDKQGADTGAGSFAARAQSAADKNANAGLTGDNKQGQAGGNVDNTQAAEGHQGKSQK